MLVPGSLCYAHSPRLVYSRSYIGTQWMEVFCMQRLPSSSHFSHYSVSVFHIPDKFTGLFIRTGDVPRLKIAWNQCAPADGIMARERDWTGFNFLQNCILYTKRDRSLVFWIYICTYYKSKTYLDLFYK